MKHSFDRKSLYQQLGNLFIGIGPILFGSAILYLLLRFVAPVSVPLAEFSRPSWAAATRGLEAVFQLGHASEWRYWVFLYLSVCISSHMQLSWEDCKSALWGFGVLVALIFIFNLAALPLGLPVMQWADRAASAMLLPVGILFYAAILSGALFAVVYAILTPFHFLRMRKWLNPL